MLHKLDNPLDSCELKFASDDPGTFTGYASVFGSVDSVGDTILKGAFEKTLEGRARPVRFLYGHSPALPLGKWTDLKEDDVGLFAKGEFTPGNSNAQNIRASVKHGAVDSLSIGFRIPPGGSEEKENGGRIIKEIELVEISVVVFPAEQNAQIDLTSVKGEIGTITTLREAESFLRDVAMFTAPMAKEFLSQLRPVFQREVETDQQIKALQDQVLRITQRSDVIRKLVA